MVDAMEKNLQNEYLAILKEELVPARSLSPLLMRQRKDEDTWDVNLRRLLRNVLEI